MDAFIRFTCFSFPAGVISSACLFSPGSGHVRHVPHVRPRCSGASACSLGALPSSPVPVPVAFCVLPSFHCAFSLVCSLLSFRSTLRFLHSVGFFICSWHVHGCAHSTILEPLVILLIGTSQSPHFLCRDRHSPEASRHCRPRAPSAPASHMLHMPLVIPPLWGPANFFLERAGEDMA